MLQQTQVATVIPYYQRWLKALPTIHSLARAPLTKVLKLWEGLGYYRRARMFHSAARHVVKKLKGRIPSTAERLMQLPGIGRYSAGAIASIAFEEKVPVLDGNVIRVLTRVLAIQKSADLSSTIKRLWEISGSMLPDQSIGDFNQALMELGAVLCSPQNPDCVHCPVRRLCKAHALHKEMSFPVRTRIEKYEKINMVALVSERSGPRFFLQRQPRGHWWAGLWTFPFWNSLAEFKVAAKGMKKIEPLGTIDHGVTRFRVKLRVFRGHDGNSTPSLRHGRWVRLEELSRAVLPAPHRKIAELLLRRPFRGIPFPDPHQGIGGSKILRNLTGLDSP